MYQSKNILFVLEHAPCGSAHAQEALDAILLASSLQHKISVLFLNEGIFLIKKDQNPEAILRKAIHKTFFALPIYEIENIFVDKRSMYERGLNKDDFFLPIFFIPPEKTCELLSEQEVIFNF